MFNHIDSACCLQPISVADCSEGQPVARLPWGGMVCPVVPMCAAALEATMRRAVAFGVSWSALSAMERHQLVNRVLDVGDAAGVSPVHSCDSQAGTTSQQEAEESFLRNIDKRCVAEPTCNQSSVSRDWHTACVKCAILNICLIALVDIHVSCMM